MYRRAERARARVRERDGGLCCDPFLFVHLRMRVRERMCFQDDAQRVDRVCFSVRQRSHQCIRSGDHRGARVDDVFSRAMPRRLRVSTLDAIGIVLTYEKPVALELPVKCGKMAILWGAASSTNFSGGARSNARGVGSWPDRRRDSLRPCRRWREAPVRPVKTAQRSVPSSDGSVSFSTTSRMGCSFATR